MKKFKKALLIFLAFIGGLTIAVLLLFWLLFHGYTRHIKTKYDDSFTVRGGGFTDDYCIMDDNSEFMETGISVSGVRKKDLHEISDSEYFRVYELITSNDDIFIIKIKKYDTFISICPSNKDYTLYHLSGKYGEMIKSELLCDPNLTEIVLPYFDELYHDEIQEIAKKLTSKDYEGLEKYGLTQEMINDKQSLGEEIRIMEDYLKNNGGN